MKNAYIGSVKNKLATVLLLSVLGSTAYGSLVISEIDVIGNKVELVNIGTNAINISSWQWCNRLNGSPFYTGVSSSSTIDTNLSTATSFNVGIGEILVVGITAGLLPNGSGELGLYNSGSFGSSSAIEDYVAWGADGIRDSVADAAGIWVSGTFITVSGLGVGDSIQLGLGKAGNAQDEYFVGASSLGIAQSVPEPEVLAFDSGSAAVSNNVFYVVLNGPSGVSTVVDCSSNLTNWTAVATNNLPGPGWELSFPITTNARFYRARTDP